MELFSKLFRCGTSFHYTWLPFFFLFHENIASLEQNVFPKTSALDWSVYFTRVGLNIGLDIDFFSISFCPSLYALALIFLASSSMGTIQNIKVLIQYEVYTKNLPFSISNMPQLTCLF